MVSKCIIDLTDVVNGSDFDLSLQILSVLKIYGTCKCTVPKNEETTPSNQSNMSDAKLQSTTVFCGFMTLLCGLREGKHTKECSSSLLISHAHSDSFLPMHSQPSTHAEAADCSADL